ncbi:D-2-hydroxyacid dehydrogenase family protein [Oceanibaculum sp.]|uniref:D-2-hydroxyacid dehydrogenase family protein n=1 Tax=Oceanibaculum sp. TaxID=1903597 RepID=UPI002589D336|nr:D-2-hydroxyacid dehydrogenase family protein [Oceanibaculum sp.]MCH2394045.1 D-2-hydroxyacid dehydrogenase family protein [Oceanibaculum sp.]
MTYRCAVLDDYQQVALKMADWSALKDRVEVTVFDRYMADDPKLAETLAPFDIICIMRERTPFRRELFAKLPKLKLLVTTGARNAAVDLAAAKEHGVMVCGTEGHGHPTAELALGMMLALARHIPSESRRLAEQGLWQSSVGIDLKDRTLGVLGLGRLGSRLARAALALDMKVIAWSQNLTPEKCAEQGVEYVGKEELFRQSDFLSVHVVLSDRSRRLVGADELALMKPSAFLINTSRGEIVDQDALVAALKGGRIAGAGVDVYDKEPLPKGHVLFGAPNLLMTPHLGYVTEDNYRTFYSQTVEDIAAWLGGKPVRALG